MQDETREQMQTVVNDNLTVDQEIAYIKKVLNFLYKTWWRVETKGLDCLPDNGSALIVGNISGNIPWPALMLISALIEHKNKHRTIHTLLDNSLIENKKLEAHFQNLNFGPWSYDNAKQLLEKGEIIVIFPEDSKVIGKTIDAKNRTRRFDWTKFLPAVELHVPIYPLSTLGIDEANMVLYNSDFLSKMLNTETFPITPFFPWLPFPFNLATMPVPWKMKIMPALSYNLAIDREDIQQKAKKLALRAEGDIQAEINRQLRTRNRLF
jgi:1-acyl-sn-glycerol-3-phosphate acyltransferase